MKNIIIKRIIISIFVGLYILTSLVSTVHVIDFFKLSNPDWLAITLAIAFEIGAAASLCAIIILDKTSRWMVWSLFILITAMQMMGNAYFAYIHLENFQGWIELFGLENEDLIYQKRILSIVSGAILPIVALGFIKSLVDYIRPESITENKNKVEEDSSIPNVEEDSNTSSISSTYLDTNNETRTQQLVEEINEIEKDSNNSIKQKEVERKIAKVIANNKEIKDKITEEIKKLEVDNKKETNSSEVSNINTGRRIYGGM